MEQVENPQIVPQPPYHLRGDKQRSGEYEAQFCLPLSRKTHAHFLFLKGTWEWVLRERRSQLCGTNRCRRVKLLEDPDAGS